MKVISVVAAVIEHDGRFLCVQRPPSKYEYTSKKFEFPGGKIEEGESEQEALKREIDEELSMQITIGEKLLMVEHQYPDFFLVMHTYHCQAVNRALILHEHIDFKWLPQDGLSQLDWAAADVPIVEKLMQR